MVSELNQIGKFKVVGKLGQGSFGIVYQGYDPDIRRDVAIKVCTVDDVGLRKRFAREAQISGNLQHKNIVTVFAADTDERGIPFLVQELLDGEDLRDLIRRRDATPSDAKIEYLIQVARGLAHAHAHGVIHRDIKPANVRLLASGKVKIMDFGIAKLASAETQLTQKGVTMGTASYLPPEQVRGGDLDHRADIFSFGVLAYELLTYERPFQGNTLSALVYQILYKVPATVGSVWPECPQALSDLVARCLEKKPEDRFASMEELLPQLERITEEIQTGKWPALLGVSTIQAILPITDDTGVMSQSDIARTAQVVEEESQVPATTLEGARTEVMPMPPSPVPPSPVPPLPVPPLPVPPPPPPPLLEVPAPATESTDSIASDSAPADSVPADSVPADSAPADSAPADSAPADSAPTKDSGPEAVTVLLSQEELTRHELSARAEQIGTLIAQGDLEKAKQRLEQTMTERLESTGELRSAETATPPTAATSETPPTAAASMGSRTVPHPLLSRPSAPASSSAPMADQPLARSGTFTDTLHEGGAQRERAVGSTSADTGSSTYMTAMFRLPAWQRWAAAALMVVLLIGAGWVFFRPKPVAAPDPSPTTQPLPPRPVANEVAGWVAIDAVPWAEVKEITNADGYTREPLADPFTPMRLELPVGRYSIQLELNAGEGAPVYSTCEIEIRHAEVAACRAEIPDRSTVTDYFKESGWWP